MLVIAPQSHLTYIAAIRDRWDFSERDRTVLNLLQPHLSQAYRNATALTDMRRDLVLARKMVESLDHGVIVRSQNGGIRFLTTRARTQLQEYFPCGRHADELPAVLEDWVRQQSSSLDLRDRVPKPMRPLVLQRAGKKLVVRSVFEEDQTLLVLEEEHTSVDPGSLESMGLTRREAEVSAWISEGKTNAEIGAILGIRPMTVKKHVERVLQKLGVENRTAAAARVLGHQKRAQKALT